jgi:hypothetical protein
VTAGVNATTVRAGAGHPYRAVTGNLEVHGGENIQQCRENRQNPQEDHLELNEMLPPEQRPSNSMVHIPFSDSGWEQTFAANQKLQSGYMPAAAGRSSLSGHCAPVFDAAKTGRPIPSRL